MGIFKKHVFVCVYGRTCPKRGSEEIWKELRNEIKAKGMKDQIRINKSGCLAQCESGPMAVVYPEEIWYSGLKVEDVPTIISNHLLNGNVVQKLIYKKSRTNKID